MFNSSHSFLEDLTGLTLLHQETQAAEVRIKQAFCTEDWCVWNLLDTQIYGIVRKQWIMIWQTLVNKSANYQKRRNLLQSLYVDVCRLLYSRCPVHIIQGNMGYGFSSTSGPVWKTVCLWPLKSCFWCPHIRMSDRGDWLWPCSSEDICLAFI